MQRRQTNQHLLKSRLAQPPEPLGLGGTPDFRPGSSLDDHFPNMIAQIQKLVNGSTPSITRMVAGVATNADVEFLFLVSFRQQTGLEKLFVARVLGSFTDFTKHSNQPLRENAIEAGNEVIRFDPHI